MLEEIRAANFRSALTRRSARPAGGKADPSDDATGLIERADAEMMRDKRRGRRQRGAGPRGAPWLADDPTAPDTSQDEGADETDGTDGREPSADGS